jgi:tetratricopeptide (TPR) repeat protein
MHATPTEVEKTQTSLELGELELPVDSRLARGLVVVVGGTANPDGKKDISVTVLSAARTSSATGVPEGLNTRLNEALEYELAREQGAEERFGKSAIHAKRFSSVQAALHHMADATRTLEIAIEESPTADLQDSLAALYLDQRRTGEAKGLLEAVSEPTVSVKLRLAYLDCLEGNFDSAGQRVREVLEIDPADYRARLFAGALHLHGRDFEAAIRSFRVAIQERSDAWLPHAHLATCFFALSQFSKAERALRTAVRLNPLSEKATLFLADLVSARGDPLEAVRLLEHLAGLQGKLLSWQATERLAKALLDSGMPKKALPILLGVVERNGTTASSLNNIGVALATSGQERKAEQHFRHAASLEISQGDSDHTAGLNLLTVLLNQRRFGEVVREFSALDKLISSPDEVVQAHLRRAAALYQLYEFEAAIQTTADLLGSLDRPTAESMRLVQFYLSATANLRLDADRATLIALDAPALLQETKPSADVRRAVLNNSAFALLQFGLPSEARRILNRVRNFVGKDPFVTATFGLLKIVSGDLEGGRNLYDSAIGLAQNAGLKRNLRIRMALELAKIYFHRGEIKSAIRWVESAKKLKPDDPGLKIELDFLKERSRSLRTH